MQHAPHHHDAELETLLRSPGSPRIRLQALLYLLTALTTFAAGAVGWQPLVLGVDEIGDEIADHWPRGLAYTVAVMAVLTAHEAGHSEAFSSTTPSVNVAAAAPPSMQPCMGT